jgi:capsular polysaccharide biosynthesis protein
MKVDVEVPPQHVAGGWVVGAPSVLLDSWSSSPLVLRAPDFQYSAHRLTFTAGDSTCPGPISPVKKGVLGKLQRFSSSPPAAPVTSLGDSAIVFDARHDATSNIAHILQNQVGVALMALSHLGLSDRTDDLCILVHADTPDYALDLFRAFGVRPIATNDTVRGYRIEMSPQELPLRSMACRYLRQRIVQLGLLSDDDPAGELLFVARRGRRSLENHEEIEKLLCARGYRTFFPENVPVDEQIRTIAGAKRIFGLHGAAIGYLMLKDPSSDGVLVEAFSDGYANNWARAICRETNTAWFGALSTLTKNAVAARRHGRQFESESYHLAPGTVEVLLQLTDADQDDVKILELLRECAAVRV